MSAEEAPAGFASLRVVATSTPQALNRTPLFQRHRAAGAKLVEFAGWEMPVSYEATGIRAEHMAVREGCGVFDVSHMGEIETSGSQALELLQRLLSNDVSAIPFDDGVGGAPGWVGLNTASSAARTAGCSTICSPTAWTPSAT